LCWLADAELFALEGHQDQLDAALVC
jgi:hypothetical protein